MTTKAKDQILQHLRSAVQALGQAHIAAIQANEMSSEVPVVREINEIVKRLNLMMPEISKLRGL